MDFDAGSQDSNTSLNAPHNFSDNSSWFDAIKHARLNPLHSSLHLSADNASPSPNSLSPASLSPLNSIAPEFHSPSPLASDRHSAFLAAVHSVRAATATVNSAGQPIAPPRITSIRIDAPLANAQLSAFPSTTPRSDSFGSTPSLVAPRTDSFGSNPSLMPPRSDSFGSSPMRRSDSLTSGNFLMPPTRSDSPAPENLTPIRRGSSVSSRSSVSSSSSTPGPAPGAPAFRPIHPPPSISLQTTTSPSSISDDKPYGKSGIVLDFGRSKADNGSGKAAVGAGQNVNSDSMDVDDDASSRKPEPMRVDSMSPEIDPKSEPDSRLPRVLSHKTSRAPSIVLVPQPIAEDEEDGRAEALAQAKAAAIAGFQQMQQQQQQQQQQQLQQQQQRLAAAALRQAGLPGRSNSYDSVMAAMSTEFICYAVFRFWHGTSPPSVASLHAYKREQMEQLSRQKEQQQQQQQQQGGPTPMETDNTSAPTIQQPQPPPRTVISPGASDFSVHLPDASLSALSGAVTPASTITTVSSLSSHSTVSTASSITDAANTTTSSSSPPAPPPQQQQPQPPSPPMPQSQYTQWYPAFVTSVHRLLISSGMHSHHNLPLVFLSLLYIARLRSTIPTSAQKAPGSEYRVFVCALVLAQKYLSDDRYSNRTWSRLSGLKLDELNSMELEFGRKVRWKFHCGVAEWEGWLRAVEVVRTAHRRWAAGVDSGAGAAKTAAVGQQAGQHQSEDDLARVFTWPLQAKARR